MEGGDPYEGNIDHLEYRPVHDPHPHAFVVCTVEHCLSKMGEDYRILANHVYIHRKNIQSLNMPEKHRMHGELLERLAANIQFREIKTLSQRAIAQARRRLREEDSDFDELIKSVA